MNVQRLLYASVCALSTAGGMIYAFVNRPTPPVPSQNVGEGEAAEEPSDPAFVQEEVAPGPEIARTPVGSAGINSAGYDEGKQILEVEYSNGHVYRWYDVPPATWYAWHQSGFHHHYFHHHIHHGGFHWRPVVHLGDTAPGPRPGTFGGPPVRLGGNGQGGGHGAVHGGWHPGGGPGFGGEWNGGHGGGGASAGHGTGGGHGEWHGGKRRWGAAAD